MAGEFQLVADSAFVEVSDNESGEDDCTTAIPRNVPRASNGVPLRPDAAAGAVGPGRPRPLAAARAVRVTVRHGRDLQTAGSQAGLCVQLQVGPTVALTAVTASPLLSPIPVWNEVLTVPVGAAEDVYVGLLATREGAADVLASGCLAGAELLALAAVGGVREVPLEDFSGRPAGTLTLQAELRDPHRPHLAARLPDASGKPPAPTLPPKYASAPSLRSLAASLQSTFVRGAPATPAVATDDGGLMLTVLSASHLDTSRGLPDPMAVLHCGRDRRATARRAQTAAPVWDCPVTFPGPLRAAAVRCEVVDARRDALLGEVDIPVAQLRRSTRPLAFRMTRDGHSAGTLLVKPAPAPQPAAAANTNSQATNPEANGRSEAPTSPQHLSRPSAFHVVGRDGVPAQLPTASSLPEASANPMQSPIFGGGAHWTSVLPQASHPPRAKPTTPTTPVYAPSPPSPERFLLTVTEVGGLPHTMQSAVVVVEVGAQQWRTARAPLHQGVARFSTQGCTACAAVSDVVRFTVQGDDARWSGLAAMHGTLARQHEGQDVQVQFTGDGGTVTGYLIVAVRNPSTPNGASHQGAAVPARPGPGSPTVAVVDRLRPLGRRPDSVSSAGSSRASTPTNGSPRRRQRLTLRIVRCEGVAAGLLGSGLVTLTAGQRTWSTRPQPLLQNAVVFQEKWEMAVDPEAALRFALQPAAAAAAAATASPTVRAGAAVGEAWVLAPSLLGRLGQEVRLALTNDRGTAVGHLVLGLSAPATNGMAVHRGLSLAHLLRGDSATEALPASFVRWSTFRSEPAEGRRRSVDGMSSRSHSPACGSDLDRKTSAPPTARLVSLPSAGCLGWVVVVATATGVVGATRSNAFVTAHCGSHARFTTRPRLLCGGAAVWDEVFPLPIAQGPLALRFTLSEADEYSDRLLGTAAMTTDLDRRGAHSAILAVVDEQAQVVAELTVKLNPLGNTGPPSRRSDEAPAAPAQGPHLTLTSVWVGGVQQLAAAPLAGVRVAVECGDQRLLTAAAAAEGPAATWGELLTFAREGSADLRFALLAGAPSDPPLGAALLRGRTVDLLRGEEMHLTLRDPRGGHAGSLLLRISPADGPPAASPSSSSVPPLLPSLLADNAPNPRRVATEVMRRPYVDRHTFPHSPVTPNYPSFPSAATPVPSLPLQQLPSDHSPWPEASMWSDHDSWPDPLSGRHSTSRATDAPLLGTTLSRGFSGSPRFPAQPLSGPAGQPAASSLPQLSASPFQLEQQLHAVASFNSPPHSSRRVPLQCVEVPTRTPNVARKEVPLRGTVLAIQPVSGSEVSDGSLTDLADLSLSASFPPSLDSSTPPNDTHRPRPPARPPPRSLAIHVAEVLLTRRTPDTALLYVAVEGATQEPRTSSRCPRGRQIVWGETLAFDVVPGTIIAVMVRRAEDDAPLGFATVADPQPAPPGSGCCWFPLIDPLGGRVGAVLLRLSDPAAMGDPAADRPGGRRSRASSPVSPSAAKAHAGGRFAAKRHRSPGLRGATTLSESMASDERPLSQSKLVPRHPRGQTPPPPPLLQKRRGRRISREATEILEESCWAQAAPMLSVEPPQPEAAEDLTEEPPQTPPQPQMLTPTNLRRPRQPPTGRSNSSAGSRPSSRRSSLTPLPLAESSDACASLLDTLEQPATPGKLTVLWILRARTRNGTPLAGPVMAAVQAAGQRVQTCVQSALEEEGPGVGHVVWREGFRFRLQPATALLVSVLHAGEHRLLGSGTVHGATLLARQDQEFWLDLLDATGQPAVEVALAVDGPGARPAANGRTTRSPTPSPDTTAVTIVALQASGLPRLPDGRPPTAFLQMEMGDARLRTSAQPASSDPTWHESRTFLAAPRDSLTVQVFSEESSGDPVWLASGTVPLSMVELLALAVGAAPLPLPLTPQGTLTLGVVR